VPHSNGITIFRRVPPAEGDGFGDLVQHATLETFPNPSYICASGSGRHIYAVIEHDGGNDKGNLLVSYSLKETGELSLIGTAETGGAVACYVEASPAGGLLAVANYVGGSVAIFALDADGRAEQRLDFKQHSGAAQVNVERQEVAHAHMAVFTPSSGRHLLVPDLGLDQVLSYEVVRNATDGTASLSDTGRALTLPPGSGPRHLTFHPSGKWVYVLTELLSTLVVCSYDTETGALTQLDNPASTLPGGVPVGVDGKSFCSAIRMSRDGAFIYASNRGHDSIAVFGVAADGRLSPGTPIQWVSTRTGEAAEALPAGCPRDFALAGEQDRWLIVGNQDCDSIRVFERSASTGKLSVTSVQVPCPAPACVVPLL